MCCPHSKDQERRGGEGDRAVIRSTSMHAPCTVRSILRKSKEGGKECEQASKVGFFFSPLVVIARGPSKQGFVRASAISDQERHIKKGKSKVEEVFAVLHRRSEESLWTRESAGGGGGDADDASDMFVWEKKGARN